MSQLGADGSFAFAVCFCGVGKIYSSFQSIACVCVYMSLFRALMCGAQHTFLLLFLANARGKSARFDCVEVAAVGVCVLCCAVHVSIRARRFCFRRFFPLLRLGGEKCAIMK